MKPLLKDPEQQKMYGHIVGMFIVTWFLITILLFLVISCVVGCKDKAKANFTGIDIDWEPNYPIDANYVELKVGKDNEIVCDSTREKYLKVMYQLMSGKEPTDTIILTFKPPEPKEPETTNWIYITDFNEPQQVSLDFIPTWPDYIELEKDLVIDIETRKEKPADKIWRFGKGTKIYFRDDK